MALKKKLTALINKWAMERMDVNLFGGDGGGVQSRFLYFLKHRKIFGFKLIRGFQTYYDFCEL